MVVKSSINNSLITDIDYTHEKAHSFLERSLNRTGFGIIKNHPVERDLIEKLYKEWAVFFNSKEKYQYSCDPEKPEGFFPLEIEKDLKECFYFYPWSKCPVYLHKITLAVYNHLLILAEEFLAWLIQTQLFSKLKSGVKDKIYSTGGTLRILHYPAISDITNSSELLAERMRLIPHKDISLLTLLPIATNPGLEILDNHDNWHTVVCQPEVLIINSGDQLSEITNDYFKSTIHRVNTLGNAREEPRYACAFFLNINLD